MLFRDLRFHVSITVVIFTLSLLNAYLVRSIEGSSISLIILIFIAGATGGIINTYIRLKDVSLETQKKLDKTSNILAIIQIYVSPLVAGLFAFVFYVLCISGLIGGELFPKFTGLEDKFISVADIFDNVAPAERLDAIKALMWGFITGFFEKLVPNILDRIKKDLETNQKGNIIFSDNQNVVVEESKDEIEKGNKCIKK